MGDYITISNLLDQLVGKHGGIRAVARVLKVDHTYLWRLWHGKKTNPSDAVLRKLGLRKVVKYEYVRRRGRG